MLPPPEAIQVLMQLEVHIESSLVAVVQIELMFRYLSDSVNNPALDDEVLRVITARYLRYV